MFPKYLQDFNEALSLFKTKFPTKTWNTDFRNQLINNYAFFSSRLEDDKLQYGETIRFLNGETIRGINLKSLTGVSKHQTILKNILDCISSFDFSEESIKSIHKNLMEDEQAWEVEFKQELIGQYRNIPTVGSRQPLFTNKEYAPHYNLEIIMSSFIDIFIHNFSDIDNNTLEKHLLTRIASFHNKFLNDIHPFADGNGRVCRTIIGIMLMKNDCPPIFPEVKTTEEQIEYIKTIIQCENLNSNIPIIEYLALGMTSYLNKQINQSTK